MARMFPSSIDSYSPTYSEKLVFNLLKNQLSDDYSVYYSVSWVLKKFDIRENSEVDFLIFNAKYGYLCVEVKGGSGLSFRDGKWYLFERGTERELKRSPHEQAEASMRYFLDLYSETYNYKYKGIFGAIVIFPMFEVPMDITHRPLELTISERDLDSIEPKIRRAFLFWRNQSKSIINFTPEQQKNFLNLVQQRLAISASAGSLISFKTEQLNQINRVQDNIVTLLEDQRQFYIRGGAGTGKTWLGIKFAKHYLKQNKRILFICFNKYLAENISGLIEDPRIQVKDLQSFIVENNMDIDDIDKSLTVVEQKPDMKYDAVIIDEAQDLNSEWAILLKSLLKNENESNLVVLYDNTQNVYGRDFGNAFMIKNEPYHLKENLRNTSSIYKWATLKSSLGSDVITNPIEGPEPMYKVFDDSSSFYRYLESLLNDLIIKENVRKNAVTILLDDELFTWFEAGKIISHKFQTRLDDDSIKLFRVTDYKGLESDVIIYIHRRRTTKVYDYVAFTRARFYLYDFVVNIS